MTAVELFTALTATGCRLMPDGERLRIQDPQQALTDPLRQAIRQQKAALLALLTQDASQAPSVDQPPCISPETPLDALQEPAHIWSAILQTDFWVCATTEQAVPLLAKGQTVYLPGELARLGQLKARWPDSFPKKLRAVHRAKEVFGATVSEVLQPTPEED